MKKKIILLKLTGTIFIDQKTQEPTRTFLDSIIEQIKELLHTKYQFGIVIGGGNFFRGSRDNDLLKLRPSIAHTIGMLGTTMNGLALYDLFKKEEISTALFCALDCPVAGKPISQEAIDSALTKKDVLIFSGGTGNPYISTDTNAVIRAQQIGAAELWKATDVDGIYSVDPKKNKNATFIMQQTYQDALKNNVQIMDQAALILAQEGNLMTRVFNIFEQDALLHAAKNKKFGSTLIHLKGTLT